VMRLTPQTTVAEIAAWYKNKFPGVPWMGGVTITEAT
jgi:hypothetical protein